MGFIHIIFGIYGGSEPEVDDAPDMIFVASVTAYPPRATVFITESQE